MCGCYEISIRQISTEIGYSKDVVERLIDRMENVHDVVRYNKETKELLILNWYKYNWSGSEKTLIGVQKGIADVKNSVFREYLENVYAGNTDVSIGYTRGT